MPANAPKPEDLELDLDFLRRKLQTENLTDEVKKVTEDVIKVNTCATCKGAI